MNIFLYVVQWKNSPKNVMFDQNNCSVVGVTSITFNLFFRLLLLLYFQKCLFVFRTPNRERTHILKLDFFHFILFTQIFLPVFFCRSMCCCCSVVIVIVVCFFFSLDFFVVVGIKKRRYIGYVEIVLFHLSNAQTKIN